MDDEFWKITKNVPNFQHTGIISFIIYKYIYLIFTFQFAKRRDLSIVNIFKEKCKDSNYSKYSKENKDRNLFYFFLFFLDFRKLLSKINVSWSLTCRKKCKTLKLEKLCSAVYESDNWKNRKMSKQKKKSTGPKVKTNLIK